MTEQQSAALPYRSTVDGEIEVLLVTSRRGSRWIIPKGNIKDGLLPWASAAREAYEEAGIIGSISATPIGIYRQPNKRLGPPTTWIAVTAFPLLVLSENPTWPEMHMRKRQWMSVEAATQAVSDEELRKIFKMFAASF